MRSSSQPNSTTPPQFEAMIIKEPPQRAQVSPVASTLAVTKPSSPTSSMPQSPDAQSLDIDMASPNTGQLQANMTSPAASALQGELQSSDDQPLQGSLDQSHDDKDTGGIKTAKPIEFPIMEVLFSGVIEGLKELFKQATVALFKFIKFVIQYAEYIDAKQSLKKSPQKLPQHATDDQHSSSNDSPEHTIKVTTNSTAPHPHLSAGNNTITVNTNGTFDAPSNADVLSTPSTPSTPRTPSSTPYSRWSSNRP